MMKLSAARLAQHKIYQHVTFFFPLVSNSEEGCVSCPSSPCSYTSLGMWQNPTRASPVETQSEQMTSWLYICDILFRLFPIYLHQFATNWKMWPEQVGEGKNKPVSLSGLSMRDTASSSESTFTRSAPSISFILCQSLWFNSRWPTFQTERNI